MESKYDIIKFEHAVVEEMRKECNMDTDEKREEAFRILEEWLLKQDHLIKKTYSRDYIERCILACNGSIEKAKLQIDRMCTMRSLHPKYFQISNIKDSELMDTCTKAFIGFVPRLTKDYYRVLIVKFKPNIYSSDDYEKLLKYFVFAAEFLKNNEVCKGFIFIFDYLEANITDVILKFNIFEFQQFMSILSAGYGCKIKLMIHLSSSKLMERLVSIIKSVLKEKLRNRIHVATTMESLNDVLQDDVKALPVEYGGNEKPLPELHDDTFATLSSKSVQELMKEMNIARTDESKRQTDKFNDQYMGMAGTFRTITLD